MYLDNAATTEVNKDVYTESDWYTSTCFGNPSSRHKFGIDAKKAIKHAREQVALAINAKPNQIFFFSSATETNNTVLSNFDIKNCSKYEHSSISHVYSDSCIPKLCSFMMVNNETGDVFDIKEICKRMHSHGCVFHTDATQAFGKVPIDVEDLDVDFLTLSGHKIHSLKGCAVLYIKNPDSFNPILIGGGQESGIHPGTENVPAIVGMGKACELFNYSDETENKAFELYTECIRKLALSDIEYAINGISDRFVYTILNISFKDIDGETLQDMLSNKGIYVSTSSACSSGKKRSRILDAMNVPDDYIYGATRISFSLDKIINDYDEYKDLVLKDIDVIIQTVKELSAVGEDLYSL